MPEVSARVDRTQGDKAGSMSQVPRSQVGRRSKEEVNGRAGRLGAHHPAVRAWPIRR